MIDLIDLKLSCYKSSYLIVFIFSQLKIENFILVLISYNLDNFDY